ncbi:uncharacterized protein L201_003573 [Kwoniella dendrophila CBS 6074]|uniref:ATPase synthesis protein 25 n=1 Tax=Kwoniella dendrophila CBS 6074 TaxID=1295534 RepID=A0AAX4JTB4_9TREE
MKNSALLSSKCLVRRVLQSRNDGAIPSLSLPPVSYLAKRTLQLRPRLTGYATSASIPTTVNSLQDVEFMDVLRTSYKGRPPLENKSLSMGDLLDNYDLTKPIPQEDLSALLRHPSNTANIITLMPSIIAFVEDANVDTKQTIEILQQLMVHLGRHQMFALLPSVVQLVLQKFNREIDVTSLDLNGIAVLQNRYKGFIQSFRFFAIHGPSRQSQPLPLPVRQQIPRIISHLLKILSSIPSSSDTYKQLHLSLPFLKHLIRIRYLTPELRKILIRHTWSHQIDLTPFQWKQCTLSAMHEENDVQAAKYRVRMKMALDRMDGQSRETHMTGMDMEENGSDVLGLATNINSERTKEINRLIGDIVTTQYYLPHGQLLSTLEPHLFPLDQERGISNRSARLERFQPEDYQINIVLRHAWSILLNRVSKDESIDTEALLEMAEALPGEAMVGHTVTPIMYGLNQRGEHMKAWEIWRDLIEKEKNASSGSKGLFIDRVTLAVASETCHPVTDLNTTIVLVDSWAKKPPTVPLPNEWDHGENWTGSIQLDAQNINILLNFCRLDGRPSVAFRLWSAALPRYGVYLDDISLNILLDIARYSESDLEDEVILSKSEQSELLKRRLRAIADEFRFSRKHDSEEDDDGMNDRVEKGLNEKVNNETWTHGSTDVLLNDPQKAWRFRREKGGHEVSWKIARRIFRQVILGNWPHLKNVESPLQIAHQGALETIVSFFSSSISSSSDNNDIENIVENNKKEIFDDIAEEIKLPSKHSKYQHILPTTNTFKSYIALLGYYKRFNEIPIVLAWMKELKIKPNFSTMCLALLHICENEGPRKFIKIENSSNSNNDNGGGGALMRDEEIIRKWLENWLGSGEELISVTSNSDSNAKPKLKKKRKIVPTEQDVAESIRWLAEKRQQVNM